MPTNETKCPDKTLKYLDSFAEDDVISFYAGQLKQLIASLTQRVKELEAGKVCELSDEEVHLCKPTRAQSLGVVIRNRNGILYLSVAGSAIATCAPLSCPHCGVLCAIQEKNSGVRDEN